MNPDIKACLAEGFRTANKSFAGMAVFAGAWVAAGLISAVLILLTQPPVDAFRQVAEKRQSAQTAVQTPQAPLAPADSTQATAPVPAGDEERQVRAWVGRAVPAVVFVVLLLIAAGIFVGAGQIGYLAKAGRTGCAAVADFVAAGRASFLPLLGAGAMSAGLYLGVMAVSLGVMALNFWLLPRPLAAVLAFLIGTAVAVVYVFLGVRLLFWNISVPADRVGTVEGLKATLNITRGRWWHVFLFSVILGLISAVLNFVFRGMGRLEAVAGGGAGAVLFAVTLIAGIAAGIYLGFLKTAAAIRYYDNCKTAGESAGTVS